MSLTLSAARGVTQVVERCEAAKENGFLDLSSCKLMYIADAVYLLLKGYSIDKVSIRDNSMKKFPKKFVTKFPEATIFNMEGNEIDELPDEFSSWISLKGLNASNNTIQTFPDAIFSLPNLIYIDLSRNKISEINVDRLYSSFPNLVKLNLSENPLTADVKNQLENNSKKPQKLHLNL